LGRREVASVGVWDSIVGGAVARARRFRPAIEV